MKPRLLLAALALLSGCNATPPAEKPVEAGRLKVGSVMQLYHDKNDLIFVVPNQGDLVEVPVGTMAKVLEDSYPISHGPELRRVRVKIDDGPKAGTVGYVELLELRPAP